MVAVPRRRAQPRPVGARRSAARAPGRGRPGRDVLHSLAVDRARCAARQRARDDHPRPPLPASCPTRTSALRGLGMRVLVPAAARRSDRVIVDAESTRRRPARRGCRVPERGRRGRRWGPRRRRSSPRPTRRAARAPRPRRRAGAADGLGQAPAQEPAAPARRARAAPGRAPAAAGGPRLPDPARAGAARPGGAELGRRRPTCASSAGCPAPTWRACTRWPTRFVFPSLYEGFGLPVLEAMRRGVPVVTSDAREPARGGGGRRAAVRPRGRGARSRPRSSGCWATRSCARRLGAAGAEQAARFTWEPARPSDGRAATRARSAGGSLDRRRIAGPTAPR